MDSSTGESAELLTGRPVEGGMRFRSPEVAMGSGSGVGLRRAIGSVWDRYGAARGGGLRGTPR